MSTQIRLRHFTGQEKTIDLQALQIMTVQQLREEAVKAFVTACTVSTVGVYCKDALQLIVDGKPLDNDSAPVSEYGVKQMATVLMVKKVDGG